MLLLFLKHWKITSAIFLALLLASITSLAIFFFPPLIPIIASISVAGFYPFAALTTMSIALASNIVTFSVGSSVLVGAFLFNQATKISNYFNRKMHRWANSMQNDIYQGMMPEPIPNPSNARMPFNFKFNSTDQPGSNPEKPSHKGDKSAASSGLSLFQRSNSPEKDPDGESESQNKIPPEMNNNYFPSQEGDGNFFPHPLHDGQPDNENSSGSEEKKNEPEENSDYTSLPSP